MTNPIEQSIVQTTDQAVRQEEQAPAEQIEATEEVSNVREVTAPLKSEQIREFFENKELFYFINYNQSKIKGSQFLTYAANLDLPCDVVFEWPMPYETYEEVLLAHMNQSTVSRITGMHVMAAQMLLVAKGLDITDNPYNLPVELETICKFIDTHKELVDRWLHFIDSTQVLALTVIERLNRHYKPREVFEIVDDKNYVGPNVAGLYDIPEFIATYHRADNFRMSYFKQQFEEYMFRGARITKYFDVKNNIAAIMFPIFALGEFKAEEVNNSFFRYGVFSEGLNLPDYKYDPDYKPELDASLIAPTNAENSTVQIGQSVVNQSSQCDAVPPQPESGVAGGV